jgi:hypothetical protein
MSKLTHEALIDEDAFSAILAKCPFWELLNEIKGNYPRFLLLFLILYKRLTNTTLLLQLTNTK